MARPIGIKRQNQTNPKICTDCGTLKHISEYNKAAKRPDGSYQLRANCKICENKKSMLRIASNYADHKIRHRYSVIKHKYGINKDEIDALLLKQDYKCCICNESVDIYSHVDHCHDSLKVRGILCIRCNTGLGQFRDSEILLSKAIFYLEGVESD